MEPTVCSPTTLHSIVRENGDAPALFAQGCSACYRNSMIILDRAPADTDRPHNNALPVLQGNATGEGYQPAVTVLDSI